MIRIFYLQPTNLSRLHLRRYSDSKCGFGQNRFHDKMINIGEKEGTVVSGDRHPHDDPRWPTQCDCGYQFNDGDTWQLFARKLYCRTDTREMLTLHEAPVGACWNADWLAEEKTFPGFYIGADGRCLFVRTPGGDWCNYNNDNNVMGVYTNRNCNDSRNDGLINRLDGNGKTLL